jgi:hypothetical protein
MPERGFQRTQRAFTAHLRDPGNHPAPADVAPERMALYRELLFNNVVSFLETGFPVLRQLLGDTAWRALAHDFFARHRSHTPYFYGIPEEFLRYLHEERGAVAGDPPFLLELAHYEWVELALSIAEDEVPIESPELEADPFAADIALSPLAWPLAYQYPVHRIGLDYQPHTAPEQPTCLAVYRDRTDQVRFLELTALTYRLLHGLQRHGPKPASGCLEAIAHEMAHPDPQALAHHGAELLRDLARRGVIGVERAESSA